MPGEIAEMMLDGTLCQGCGEFMGEAQGFPGFCSKECAGALWCEPTPRPKRQHYTPPDPNSNRQRKKNARYRAQAAQRHTK